MRTNYIKTNIMIWRGNKKLKGYELGIKALKNIIIKIQEYELISNADKKGILNITKT